jgi:hypothetical protein
LTIELGVVAAIRVVGVRDDPCGAMRWTVFYTESDGIGCSLRVLLLASFLLDIGVSRLQLTVSADFIEENGRICFQ